MTKAISWEIEFDGIYAHIIQRPSGMHTVLYEIRYRKNGYNIDVSSTDLHEAKRKFVEAAKYAGLIKEQVLVAQTEKNEKLVHLLNLNGLTAYKVAEMLGYADSSRVYKWLYNKGAPNALTMLKLTEILHCSAEDILYCFAYKGNKN